MFPTVLWPPLKLVEATLEGAPALEAIGDDLPLQANQNQGGSSKMGVEKNAEAAYLLLPLTELAKRRAGVAARGFSIEWASGRLAQITVNGAVLGVLLDRIVQGKQWTGWLAANESNWASSFDVLLEPCDDPFEPMFGIIQAWNPVTLHWSQDLQARIVCEISAVRLAAVRAVALECAAGLIVPTPVEPGRIALRTAGGTFSVLTGTPLGLQDLRHDYQNAYRTVAARLMALQLTRRVSKVEKKRVVPAAPATAGLRVQWKRDARMDEVQQLLQATSTSIADGPDAEGFYRLKSSNAMAAQRALSQSQLVCQVMATDGPVKQGFL